MRLRPVLVALGLSLPLAGVVACGPSKPSDPELARGYDVFQQNCASCHGEKGEGNTAPRLIGIADVYSVQQQTAKVTNGVPGSRMPAWKDKLSPADIAAVVRYTRESLK